MFANFYSIMIFRLCGDLKTRQWMGVFQNGRERVLAFRVGNCTSPHALFTTDTFFRINYHTFHNYLSSESFRRNADTV